MKYAWAQLEAMSDDELDAAVTSVVFHIALSQVRPRYSTTWQGAGLILDRMRELGWQTHLNDLLDMVGVTFERPNATGLGKASTAPRAVAIAAVMACQAELPVDDRQN